MISSRYRDEIQCITSRTDLLLFNSEVMAELLTGFLQRVT